MSPTLCSPAGSAGCGSERLTGAGLAARELAGKQLVVRPRSGGERIKLVPNRPTRTLKNLLQEAGVPQWQRDRLPLLVADEHVLWVAQLGIDCRFAAAAENPASCPPGCPAS